MVPRSRTSIRHVDLQWRIDHWRRGRAADHRLGRTDVWMALCIFHWRHPFADPHGALVAVLSVAEPASEPLRGRAGTHSFGCAGCRCGSNGSLEASVEV